MSYLVCALAVSFVVWLVVARARQNRRAGRTGELHERPGEPLVTIDDWGVRHVRGGIDEAVAWAELVKIDIVTSSDGPLHDDVRWLFYREGGGGCVIPSRHVGDALFARLARLEGVDHQAIVMAMGCTGDCSFPIWHGDKGDALSAGDSGRPSPALDLAQ